MMARVIIVAARGQPDHRASKALPDPLVPRDYRVSKALPDPLVPRDYKAGRGLPVSREKLEQQVRRERLDQPDRRGPRGLGCSRRISTLSCREAFRMSRRRVPSDF